MTAKPNRRNEFLNLWDSLTLNQKKTLKLTIFSSGKDMYYAGTLQAFDLNAGSQVTRALSKPIRSDLTQVSLSRKCSRTGKRD